jgi:penicillin-binding protein 2
VVVYGTGGNGNLGEGYPPAAGKTGTAEDQPRLSHAWYVGYAPYENPEIVVATFLENSGGGGGTMAAPMARDVLRAYFDLQRE